MQVDRDAWVNREQLDSHVFPVWYSWRWSMSHMCRTLILKLLFMILHQVKLERLFLTIFRWLLFPLFFQTQEMSKYKNFARNKWLPKKLGMKKKEKHSKNSGSLFYFVFAFAKHYCLVFYSLEQFCKLHVYIYMLEVFFLTSVPASIKCLSRRCV